MNHTNTSTGGPMEIRDTELGRLFKAASGMEDPIATLRDLLRSIFAVATGDGAMPDERDALAVMRLIQLGEGSIKEIEVARGELFEGLHPYAYGPEAPEENAGGTL